MIYTINIIGNLCEDNLNGDWIGQNIIDAAAMSDCEGIDIHINSYGGDLRMGMSIYNAIQTVSANVPIHTYNDFFAYSATALLALAGQKKYATKYATYLFHNPYYEGYVSENDNLKQVLDSVVIAYSQTLSMTEDEVRAKFFTGQDVTISAQTALDLGLIDAIVDLSEVQIMANSAKIERIYNELKNSIYTLKMEKENEKDAPVLTQDKPVEDTTTEYVTKSDLEAVLNQLEELKTTLTPKVFDKEELEVIINKAIQIANAEAPKAAEKPVTISQLLKSNILNSGDKYAGKTHRELEKIDPTYLMQLKRSNPEAYQILFNESYAIGK